jgi:hypothetical protein
VPAVARLSDAPAPDFDERFRDRDLLLLHSQRILTRCIRVIRVSGNTD